MKLVMVLINDHAYRMSHDKAMRMIKMIKKEQKSKNMILALCKDNLIEMRKDIFNSKKEMLEATQQWLKKGYKVYTTYSLM